jgi:hypothetical protein
MKAGIAPDTTSVAPTPKVVTAMKEGASCAAARPTRWPISLLSARRLEACQKDCSEQQRQQKIDGAVDYQRRRHRAGRCLATDGVEDSDFENPEATRDMAQHAQGEGCGIDGSEGDKARAGGG